MTFSKKDRVLAINTDWGRPNSDGKYGAVGWYRIINGWEKIGADVQKGEYRLQGAKSALEMKERGDIWVTKLMDGDEVVRQLLVDRDFVGAKLILDLDDDPFHIDPSHPAHKHFAERQELYKYFIREADHIVCSTEEIANVVREHNNKISIIPNSIDPSIWQVSVKPRKDKKIRIGWIGSASHMVDIPVLEEFMDDILAKYPHVEFHLAGMTGKDKHEPRVFNWEGTKGYEEYPQYVADKQLDIAIAPLKDTQFNRCKSNIKFLEHAMLKTPMVLSDVKTYNTVKNYKTGYLAKNKSQWIKYLSWLIESEEKRREIGEAAYQYVLENWTTDKFLEKYREVVEKVRKKDIVVYTSVTSEFDRLSDKQNTKNAHFVAFTDQKSDVWKVEKNYDKFNDHRRNSRIQKMMPHLYFPDYQYSVYIDGNIELKVPAEKLVEEWLKDKDIAVFRHIGRDCLYQEAEACVIKKKETPEELARQIKEYARRGIKNHSGLAECGVIVRRHTPEVERMNEKWWAEYCRFSSRDQMSFPVAFDLKKVNLIESSVWRHPYFKIIDHKK